MSDQKFCFVCGAKFGKVSYKGMSAEQIEAAAEGPPGPRCTKNIEHETLATHCGMELSQMSLEQMLGFANEMLATATSYLRDPDVKHRAKGLYEDLRELLGEAVVVEKLIDADMDAQFPED